MPTHLIFPTVIGEYQFDDARAVNPRVAEWLYRKRAAERGVQDTTTVNRGWQSDRHLLARNEPVFDELMHFFRDSVADYLKAAERYNQDQPTPGTPRYNYEGWAVMIESDGYQDQHVHSRVDLIGVYCVQAEERNEVEGRGDLVLFDPRGGRLAMKPYWEKSIHRVPPVPGRLALVPGFLAHRVDRYAGKVDRVTLNFEIAITGMDPRST